MHTKETAYKLLDQCIADILKRTPGEFWHELLNELGDSIKLENRNFIAPLDLEYMSKILGDK